MKFGVSLATTTPLPRAKTAQSTDRVDDGLVCVGRGNDLQQREVSRRIEEMGSQPPTAEFVAAPLGNGGNGYTRRIGTNYRVGAAMRFNLGHQRLLDVETFDDCFCDPVAILDPGQIGVQSAHGDPVSASVRKKRIRTQLFRAA